MSSKINFSDINQTDFDYSAVNKSYFALFIGSIGSILSRKLDISISLNSIENQMVMSDGQSILERRELTPEIVRKLYWEEKKSLPEIGMIFGMPHGTIHGWMKRWGIPTRRISEGISVHYGLQIPSYETLFRLYWKERKSASQIAEQLDVCKFTVRKWLKLLCIPQRSPAEGRRIYPRYPFSSDEKERAYLLGFCAGDVHVRKTGQTILVTTGSTHPAFIELFLKLFSRYGHCRKTPSRSKIAYQWKVSCGLDDSFSFLLAKKQVKISTETFFPFLAGYSDAEGYWRITKASKCDGICLELRIASKDLEILKQIKDGLEKRGFTPSLRPEKSGLSSLSLRKRAEVLLIARELLSYSMHREKLMKILLITEFGQEKYWSKIKGRVESIKLTIYKEVEKCKQKAKEALIERRKDKIEPN